MEYNIDELEWKCLDSGVTAAPTNSDYMKLLKREVVAKNLKGAQSKGIELPGMKPGGWLPCSQAECGDPSVMPFSVNSNGRPAACDIYAI